MENQTHGPSQSSPQPLGGVVSASLVPDDRRRLEAPPQQIVIRQGGSGFFLRLFASLGWMGFVVCGLVVLTQFLALGQYFDTTEGITERYHSLSKSASISPAA